MEKLTLNIEDLKVESFDTTLAEKGADGAIHAFGGTCASDINCCDKTESKGTCHMSSFNTHCFYCPWDCTDITC